MHDANRMGQTRRVHVHRLLAPGSVDELMLETLRRKTALFSEYARRSGLSEATPDAVDISSLEAAEAVVNQAEAERQIIESERLRLRL